MKRKILIACLTFWLAACTTQPTPTATFTTAPSNTPTETPIPSPTFTPTPSLTPTLTLTPTHTPTPQPTPTPKGFYSSNQGFTLIYPPGWKFVEESAGEVVFENSWGDINLFVNSYEDESNPTFNEVAADVKSSFTDLAGLKLSPLEDIELGDGTVAPRALITGTNSYQVEVGFEFLFTQHGPMDYFLIFVGPREALEADQATLDRIFKSFVPSAASLYGIDRSQALILLGGADPIDKDLDPARCICSTEYLPMFSGLVRLTPQLQIEPDLAENWTVSPDGLVYTFTLREGLTFASGRPLTALDVKFSWERACDPETESSTARTYLGDILGANEKLDGKADEISGVKVIDERTLEVTLDRPKPYFLAKLTYPTGFVVDREEIEASPKDWMFSSNASGPFKIREYREGEAMIFERNPAYHTPPELGYAILLLNRAGSQVSYYEAGDVDLAYVPYYDLQRFKDLDNPHHAEMVSTTAMCTSLIYIDNTMPPTDDLQVRKALALALDKDRLHEILSESNDLRADSILPPAMPGYSSEFPPQAFDPTLAKEALKASQYAGKIPPISITTSGYSDSEDPVLDAMIDMWRKNLGVKFEVKYLDPDTFDETIQDLHGNLVLSGWCADYPDPQNFIDILFHSQSEMNYTQYSNQEVDAIVENARTEADADTRLAQYHQAEELLLEDYAAIPLWHPVYYQLISPQVKGYTLSPMDVLLMHLITLEK